jgi:D-psicose/D-tagatose/L-ribulose 3-epimerase
MCCGMNLLLWATHVTGEQFPLLGKLKKAGFDGVEISLFEGDVNHYRRLRKELDNLGLKATPVTVIPSPAKSPISADPAARQAGLNYLRWAIEMTALLGGDVMAGPYHSPLSVFSGTGIARRRNC